MTTDSTGASEVTESTNSTGSKASRLVQGLIASQLSIDPRTLGATRIAMASLLLFDLAKRWADLATWYTNSGLLPNHTLLWRPIRHWQMSFLWMFSHWHEVAIAFALIAIVYLALLVGYRTRLAQVLSLICLISLQVRIDLVSNGGDFVFCALLWWTVFLPMGKRFSVDAVARSLRRGPETPPDVRAFAARPRDTTPVVSLAVLAATVQLSVIYLFNALHKQGPTWSEGSAIHYFLQQERILTPLGLLAREHLPFWITQATSYATLVIEGILPLLILSPLGRPWTRRLALVLLFGLHVNIALISNVGVFSPAMCVFGTLLLTGGDWDALRAFASRRRGRILLYDAGCGVCFQLARILARLDFFGRLEIRSNRDTNDIELPEGFDLETLDDTLLVIDPQSGRYWVMSAAWAELARALPLGFLVSWILRVPGLRILCDRAYSAFSRNRAEISQFFGYAACGIAPLDPAPLDPASAPLGVHTGWTRWRAGLRVGLREVAVSCLIFVATAQLLHENWALPDAIKIRQLPRWIEASVSYTRLNQGWKMFAPDAPRTELNLIVNARTVDGRIIDPVRAAVAGSDEFESTRIVVQPGHNVYWADYIARIEGHGSYHDPLRFWIMSHHERTGNPEDRVVSFQAAVIEQDSPAPGETEPTNVRHRVFLAVEPSPN